MTKAELIEALSNEAGLTTSKAKEVVRVFFDEISNALTNNEAQLAQAQRILSILQST